MSLNAADSCNKACSSRRTFVYGFIDLFSGSDESWQWGLDLEESHGINPSVQSQTLDRTKHGYDVLENKIDQKGKPSVIQEVKQVPIVLPVTKLDTLEEECEDNSKNLSASASSGSISGLSVGTGTTNKAKVILKFLLFITPIKFSLNYDAYRYSSYILICLTSFAGTACIFICFPFYI